MNTPAMTVPVSALAAQPALPSPWQAMLGLLRRDLHEAWASLPAVVAWRATGWFWTMGTAAP